MTKIKQPSILALDYDEKILDSLRENGYKVLTGKSGFVDRDRLIPQDSSETNLILWNVAECDFVKYRQPEDREKVINKLIARTNPTPFIEDEDDIIVPNEADNLKQSGKTFKTFLEEVRKNGFLAIFMGSRKPDGLESEFLSLSFDFKSRYTKVLSDVGGHPDNDPIPGFFNKNINFETLKYSIGKYNNNYDVPHEYLIDNDKNCFSVILGEQDLFLIPEPISLGKATKSLLTDVLPKIANWLFDGQAVWIEKYRGSEFAAQKVRIEELEEKFSKEMSAEGEKLQTLAKESLYLTKLLTDDGDSLKISVKYTLENDLGFTDVVDMDEVNEAAGATLKEDLRVNSNLFVEVKGTEGGAKASWIKELNSNMLIYHKKNDSSPKGMKAIIVFNQDRKTEPIKRESPYASDPPLVKSCLDQGILLLPTFELYKLVSLIRDNKVAAKTAREAVAAESGLFSAEALLED